MSHAGGKKIEEATTVQGLPKAAEEAQSLRCEADASTSLIRPYEYFLGHKSVKNACIDGRKGAEARSALFTSN